MPELSMLSLLQTSPALPAIPIAFDSHLEGLASPDVAEHKSCHTTVLLLVREHAAMQNIETTLDEASRNSCQV